LFLLLQKKDTVVAFFTALRCSAAPEEEEGNDNNATVAFFAMLRYSATPQEHSKEEQTKQTKQTNEKKCKDAYLGPA
jgi:hypothetical protein